MHLNAVDARGKYYIYTQKKYKIVYIKYMPLKLCIFPWNVVLFQFLIQHL